MRVPSESFSVLIEESNGAQHLTLEGWLDAAAAPTLLAAVTRARPRDVTIDIDRLVSIDGAGWLGVVACEQRVTDWGGRLRIDNGIRKILDLASA
jgi:ABC-type transporter Mla MlaB component